ncbi:MAG: cytochrome c maturation protein CcmE [Gaiella sp.]
MARKSSPARLVIALSIAGVLAVFLLYTSIAGGGTPSVSPSELSDKEGTVALAGMVVGPVRGDAYEGGMRFALKDIDGDATTRVVVLYTGSVPDQFRVGRHVVVDGAVNANGVFVAEPGSMITKCPSKYQAAETTPS